ncbi:MAG TPA: HDIG domain-containing protein [Clostridiaceae bacterium]|nr:HDIG domain-containing protein [Clostridiaceae bacterium]
MGKKRLRKTRESHNKINQNHAGNKFKTIRQYLKSNNFYRLLIGLLTTLIVYVLIQSGAAPVKYDIKPGDISNYDITAPRDIENYAKMEENARKAAESVQPVIKRIENADYELLNKADEFISGIEGARLNVEKVLQEQGIGPGNRNYREKLQEAQTLETEKLWEKLQRMDFAISQEQVFYLIAKVEKEQLELFSKTTRNILYNTMKEEITEDNLESKIIQFQNQFNNSADLNLDLKNIGSLLIKSILKPNSVIDIELTEAKREEAAQNAMSVKVIIKKGSRILSIGDTVTEDKYRVLQDLNLIETGKFDYSFAFGIFVVVLLASALVIVFMNYNCPDIVHSLNDIMVLSVIIVLTVLLARVINEFSALLIPIFIAPMLISILLNVELAIVVNFVLSVLLSFITKTNTPFLYMSLISGTLSAFIVSKANQRSKLSLSGIFVGLISALTVICIGLVEKAEIKTLLYNSLIVLINGMVSIIFTIGILPFMEIAFKVITPLKLLELANPNQPLIKRLLIEAPGTYHHSLMVGNLAEVATEAIGGNALLARVGAYYHDIGKLIRPNFFIENQLSDNPHDKMSPNLSTLVITSHVSDGVALAQKYKIPMAITNIIQQHHGDTIVAYFYHKALKSSKGDLVKPADFRYDGPKPGTKEAAVVMLADSVEAAVRSMTEKTEGKIEGLVRKIIKDKLDDGQLDECNLTLKDLNIIAKSFMQVFSGYFHGREEYPELHEKRRNIINSYQDDENKEENEYNSLTQSREKEEGCKYNGNIG